MTQYMFSPRDLPTQTSPSGTGWNWYIGTKTATGSSGNCATFQQRAIKITQTANNSNPAMLYFSAWNSDANRATSDVLIAWKANTDSANYLDVYIRTRCSGTETAPTGYSVRLRTAAGSAGTAAFLKYSGSPTPTTLKTSSAFTMNNAAVYWTRFRATGTTTTTLSVRVWADGTDEPAAWTDTVNDSSSAITAAGAIGLSIDSATTTAGYVLFDFVAVGTGGDEAPTPRTDTEYRAWLAQDGVRRCILAELGMMDTATPTVKYLSNMPYSSAPADDPASQPYIEAIVKAPDSRFAAGNLLIGRTSLGFGDLVLDNAGGVRDAWARANTDGQDCLVLIGGVDWPRYDFRPLLRGTISDIVSDGDAQLRVNLRERIALADVVLNAATIASGDNIHRPIPRVFGQAWWIEPVAIDAATVKWQVNDGAITAVGDAYDGGVAATSSGTINTVSTPTITMTANHGMLAGWEIVFATSAGNITAGTTYFVKTASGNQITLSDTYGGATKTLAGTETGTWTAQGRAVDYTNGYIYFPSEATHEWRLEYVTSGADITPAAVISEAVSDAGLAGVYADDMNGRLSTAYENGETGYYLTDTTHLVRLLELAATDLFAMFGAGRDGLIGFKTITPANSVITSRLTLTDDDIVGGVRIDRIAPPIAQVIGKATRQWSPSRVFASSVDNTDRTRMSADFRDYYVYAAAGTDDTDNHAGAINSEEYETSGWYQPPGQIRQCIPGEAYQELREEKLAVLSFTTTLKALILDVGDVITLEYPRWGFDAGVEAQVVSLEDDIAGGTIRLGVKVLDFYQVAAP